jgi:hypothetical protein
VDTARVTSPHRYPSLFPLPRLYLRQIVDGDEVRAVRDPRFHPKVLASSVLSMDTALSGPSQLLLVRHGVTLDREPLLPDFGCQVVLMGEHLPLDLSQLKARESPLLDAARKQARALIAEGAQSVLAQLSGVPEPKTSEGGGAVWLGCAALAMVLASNLPAAGLMLLMQGLVCAGAVPLSNCKTHVAFTPSAPVGLEPLRARLQGLVDLSEC